MSLIKEVLRHGLRRAHLDRLILTRKRRRGYVTSHLDAPTLAERFAAIYDQGAWVLADEQSSRSGVGSELAATESLRPRVASLLRELGAERVIDVGCGDFHWMADVDFGGSYIGLDIVPSVIAANEARFSSPDREFVVLDATREPLPPGDVVLCREVLFHLSFAEGRALLQRVLDSGATFFIATSDRNALFNADIRSGDFRPLNLQRRPYRLPAPERWVEDDAVAPGRALGVWRLSRLRPGRDASL